jgi:tRNA (mo5U34)-methyltransferase
MKREEILREVERLRPWFHKIDLGRGVTTKTKSSAGEADDHPLGYWKIIQGCVPEDLSGKSVLDVGCNAGFYSVEAKRRGAARVLGVDAQRHHVEQARFVGRALDLDVEFRRVSVYDLDPREVGHFDLTLALGLIYHCKHPVLALEKLFLVTRGLLVLETAIIAEEKEGARLRSFMRRADHSTPRLHPLAYLENEIDSKEPVYNWFYPSVACLEALLRNVGFEGIEVFSVTRDGRAVLLCRKRELYPDSTALTYLASSLAVEWGPGACAPGAEVRLRVRAENTGLARWLAAGEAGTEKGAVRLGAHLLTAEGAEMSRYHARAALARDVAPGGCETVELAVRAPEGPGRYVLEIDMVSEHLAWFEDLGSKTVRHELRVG